MNLEELISRTRALLDDTNPEAHLWEDEDLIAYANAAQREACRRADLLIDSSTPSVCRINLVAGTAVYPLSPLVIKVIRAVLSSTNTILHHLRTKDLDYSVNQWTTRTGTPEAFVIDSQSNAIRVYPIPVSTDILRLTVSRYPLNELSDPSDTPEIDEQYHFGLIDWMCHLAYMKQDAETVDLIKSKSFQTFFDEKFGPRPSAMTEVYRKVLPGTMNIRCQRFGG